MSKRQRFGQIAGEPNGLYNEAKARAKDPVAWGRSVKWWVDARPIRKSEKVRAWKKRLKWSWLVYGPLLGER